MSTAATIKQCCCPPPPIIIYYCYILLLFPYRITARIRCDSTNSLFQGHMPMHACIPTVTTPIVTKCLLIVGHLIVGPLSVLL